MDGANGVGALKVRELAEHMAGLLKLEAVFDGSDGILNEKVYIYL